MEAAAWVAGGSRYDITHCGTSASAIKIVKTEQVLDVPPRHASVQQSFAGIFAGYVLVLDRPTKDPPRQKSKPQAP
jgi:hypothetical protein